MAKRILSFVLVAAAVLGLLSGCSRESADQPTAPSTGVTIRVAAAQTDYGKEMWEAVCKTFTEKTGIAVELTINKSIEDFITEPMQNGDHPDVVHLGTGRLAGLTENLVRVKALHELTNVLNMTVPGEDQKVSEKLVAGFAATVQTNPYTDGKTYMAPMFYTPSGLYYNEKLFLQKGWKIPETWEEMWALAEKAKAEGISLFTYRTAADYETFLYALMYCVGGADFFSKATTYAEGVWDSPEAKKMFEVMDKLAGYTHKDTPKAADSKEYEDNQMLVLQNKALFIPGGNWIVGETADAISGLNHDFAWGVTALPALTKGGDRYAYCWMEQTWIPAGAKNKEAAEQFVAFLYSDVACGMFANTQTDLQTGNPRPSGAVQPVIGMANQLEGNKKLYYSVYESGAKAAAGYFADFHAIDGVTIGNVFLQPIDELTAGTLTIEEYASNIKTASDLMRENLKN